MSLYKDMQKTAAQKQAEEEVTMASILDGPVKRPAESRVYKSAEERCATAKSTSMALFLVGGLGLLAMLLSLTGILSLQFPRTTSYSMSVLFLIFILTGFYFIQKSKKLLAGAEAEHARIRTITDWFQTDEAVLSEMKQFCREAPVNELEALYRAKYDAARRLLREHFTDEDPSLLDMLAADFAEDARIDAMLEEQVRVEAAVRSKRTS